MHDQDMKNRDKDRRGRYQSPDDEEIYIIQMLNRKKIYVAKSNTWSKLVINDIIGAVT